MFHAAHQTSNHIASFASRVSTSSLRHGLATVLALVMAMSTADALAEGPGAETPAIAEISSTGGKTPVEIRRAKVGIPVDGMWTGLANSPQLAEGLSCELCTDPWRFMALMVEPAPAPAPAPAPEVELCSLLSFTPCQISIPRWHIEDSSDQVPWIFPGKALEPLSPPNWYTELPGPRRPW